MIDGDGQSEEDRFRRGPGRLVRAGGRSSKEESGASFVGVVFNRPIDQVLTYRVPAAAEQVDPAGPARAGAAGTREPA